MWGPKGEGPVPGREGTRGPGLVLTVLKPEQALCGGEAACLWPPGEMPDEVPEDCPWTL